jgi:hypothetical protein
MYLTRRESQIPIQYKVLICLRIMGRGHDFDTSKEISLVPTSTCHHLFYKFIWRCAIHLFPLYVKMPEGVHASEVGKVTGKEKVPTLAFQCVVDHDKRVLLVSKLFWVAANDNEILRNVPEIQQFLQGKYNNINYTIYDKYGREIYLRGAYMICVITQYMTSMEERYICEVHI